MQMRRNPLLFKQEEYEFLHRVYLSQESTSKFFQKIQRKSGVGLDKKQILYVKKKFAEWKERNPHELLWMENEA